MANTTGKKWGGRKKGTTNKDTAKAKEAIAKFVDDNSERFQGWLDEIAADNPKEAMELVIKVIEYHIPKLARTENKLEGQVGLTVNINYPED